MHSWAHGAARRRRRAAGQAPPPRDHREGRGHVPRVKASHRSASPLLRRLERGHAKARASRFTPPARPAPPVNSTPLAPRLASQGGGNVSRVHALLTPQDKKPIAAQTLTLPPPCEARRGAGGRSFSARGGAVRAIRRSGGRSRYRSEPLRTAIGARKLQPQYISPPMPMENVVNTRPCQKVGWTLALIAKPTRRPGPCPPTTMAARPSTPKAAPNEFATGFRTV